MRIEYVCQPPKRYTFEQPKTKLFVERFCKGKTLNLFAGKTKLDVDEFRVDMDKTVIADYYGDAFTFTQITTIKYDTIVLDPPWSIRKSMEKYGGRMISSYTKIKNELTKILNPYGRIISVGYSSTGMSKSRGFTKIALLVICCNGAHDDSFVTVEDSNLNMDIDDEKDLEVLVEQHD